jgi:putative ubiquitin-RnfH superfamily antitoxin RatB of RatAB toxin-antitoxin module
MSGAPRRRGRKRCVVTYATPARQYLWTVELPAAASIADALAAARSAADPGLAVPWDSAAVGVFGEVRARTDVCAPGDRIEIYRPLRHDPRTRRRERLRGERRRG